MNEAPTLRSELLLVIFKKGLQIDLPLATSSYFTSVCLFLGQIFPSLSFCLSISLFSYSLPPEILFVLCNNTLYLWDQGCQNVRQEESLFFTQNRQREVFGNLWKLQLQEYVYKQYIKYIYQASHLSATWCQTFKDWGQIYLAQPPLVCSGSLVCAFPPFPALRDLLNK